MALVTIVMPCLDEARFIEACLRSVEAQSYPPEQLEILVADGGSTDGTRGILSHLAAEDRRIRVVDNPERIQAKGLNRLLREARGAVIVRMDVHCEYAPDYIAKCVEVLERTGADNVGGAQRCRARTRFQRAVCAALASPLGVGGAAYRSATREGFVDTVFLGAFRRSVFETVGLYDPEAVTNEDADLNQRIVAAGGRLYLSPEIVVHYEPRASLPALARQYFRYGRGRARTLLKHRQLLTLRPALPFLGIVGLALLALVPAFRPLLPWALAVYVAVTGGEAVRLGLPLGPSFVPLVWAVFPALHFGHGSGFGLGLLRYGLRPDWGTPERLSAPPPRSD